LLINVPACSTLCLLTRLFERKQQEISHGEQFCGEENCVDSVYRCGFLFNELDARSAKKELPVSGQI
jgi:hypothetical protein